jgi:hypothetical protein
MDSFYVIVGTCLMAAGFFGSVMGTIISCSHGWSKFAIAFVSACVISLAVGCVMRYVL